MVLTHQVREHSIHRRDRRLSMRTESRQSDDPGGKSSSTGLARLDFSRLGLYRSPRKRIVAGVAGGIGERLGVEPALVRIAFALLSVAALLGLVLYAVLWAVLPEDRGRMKCQPPTARRSAALVLVVLGVLGLLRPSGLWLGDAIAASVVMVGLGVAFLWFNASGTERARWSRNVVRPGSEGAGEAFSPGPKRLIGGAALLVTGVATFLVSTNLLNAAPGAVLAVVATVAGLTILFGPWAWRLVGELAEERIERIRSQERAQMAAHLHDSVLQTLALIQRSGEPKRMVALARNQERELRAWLSGHTSASGDSLAATVQRLASEVELRFKVPVEVVTVGECSMDERVQSMVEAAREAVVNAAMHSGASQVSVFVEVEPELITAFVRDEGSGFDPDRVAPDRRGIAESIRGRMERCGGTAGIVTEPGSGTEVQLSMPRHR